MTDKRLDRRRLLAAAGGLGLLGHAAAAEAANPLAWLKKTHGGHGAPAHAAAPAGPVVDTRSGKIVGQQLDGCVAFRGVPYGA